VYFTVALTGIFPQ